MYGLIGSFKAAPGKRDELIEQMLRIVHVLPGCLSYVIATDPGDADAVWITEVWDSAESHRASLGVPEVQAVIAQARPLIAAMGERRETVPVGGHGLARA